MRLIDADALNIRKYTRWFENVEDVRQVERMIREAPTISPSPNDPLTLEELREMDGEPVWVQYGQYDGEWVIVAWNIYDAISYVRKAPFKLFIHNYENEWLAYRRKPEEEGNGDNSLR